MTVQSTTRKAGPFYGNGVTTVFPFSFKILKKQDLLVVHADAQGVESNLVLDSDYTVTLNADQDETPGGSFTYPKTGDPMPTSERLVAVSNAPNTQLTDLTNSGGFYPQTVEDMSDRSTIQIQQLAEKVERSVKFPITEDVGTTTLPSAQDRAGKLWGFDVNGDSTVVPAGAIIGVGDPKTDIFTAGTDFTPDVSTQLTLSRSYGSLENIKVFFDTGYQGIDQLDGLNGKVLTFKSPIPTGVTRVYVIGGSTISIFKPAAGTVTDETVADDAGISADKLSYLRDAPGAVPRTGRVKWDDIVSAKDFNIKANGSFDDTSGLLDLLDYFQTADDFRGGRVYLPNGRYMFSQAMAFQANANGLHNMIIHGDGPLPVILDFTGAPAGTDGISFNAGAHVVVQDLMIYNAKRDAMVLGAGTTPGGGGGSTTHVMLKNLRIQETTRHGVQVGNGFMISMDEVFSWGSGSNGFNIEGFVTSTKLSRCYAWLSGAVGWLLNGMTYSSLNTCGSDSNGTQGYACSNLFGVGFNSCGAEENGADAWAFFTSDASVGSLPVQDIHGVTLDSCMAVKNSKNIAGAYGSLIGAYPSNSRPVEISVRGGGAIPNSTSDRAMVLAGTGGQITVHKDLVSVSQFSQPDSIAGSVEVMNYTVTGRRSAAQLGAATQSLTSGVVTPLSLSNTPVMNDLGSTFSSNKIIIGRDVHRVRISGSIEFDANGTGRRTATVRVNGIPAFGVPDVSRDADGVGGTKLAIPPSVPIFVTEGDQIDVAVFQNSGGALNVLQGNSTYLCVEGLG